MAIKDGSTDTQMSQALRGAGVNAAGTPPSPQPAQATMNNQQPQAPAAPTLSLRSFGSQSRMMMSRTPASEVLSKLTKSLEDIYTENAEKSFEYTLIPIDMMATPNLSVSVLVLAVRDKQNLPLGVAYHTLLIEASTENPTPKTENIGGQVVEIMRTVSDAYSPVMIDYVADQVAKRFPQSNLFNTDATLVPRDLKLDDRDIVWRIASNTAFACSQELEINSPSFQDLNLGLMERDSTLLARPTFLAGSQAQLVDVVGHPLRADVQIEFNAAPINQNQNSLDQNVERTSAMARLAGFMDLVWSPSAPPQVASFGAAPGWGGQAPSFQRYRSRFVMTLHESQQLLTVPAQLLALLPAMALDEGNYWIQAFRPQQWNDKGVDWKDIGAIGIEVNFEGNASGIGSRIDTKADSFKPDETLHQLVTATFSPGMILSLDVPEVGGSTWYNGVFAAAAQGDPRANKAIIAAANQLTNGEFDKYFQGAQVATDENNRIHLGYFTDKNGVRRDLRELDYLAVLNLHGDKDPGVAREWSDTFMRTEYNLATRLAARKRIILNSVSDPTFTGFACRCTLLTDFVTALVKATLASGLVMRRVNNYADLGSYERATGAHLGNTVLSPASSGLFTQGGFGGQAGQGAGHTRQFAARNSAW